MEDQPKAQISKCKAKSDSRSHPEQCILTGVSYPLSNLRKCNQLTVMGFIFVNPQEETSLHQSASSLPLLLYLYKYDDMVVNHPRVFPPQLHIFPFL